MINIRRARDAASSGEDPGRASRSVRLQTVIRAAGELNTGEYRPNPEVPGEFRRHMDGLVWGPSVKDQREENRYYHNKLGFSFEHPPQWQVTASAKEIVASAPDGSLKRPRRFSLA